MNYTTNTTLDAFSELRPPQEKHSTVHFHVRLPRSFVLLLLNEQMTMMTLLKIAADFGGRSGIRRRTYVHPTI